MTTWKQISYALWGSLRLVGVGIGRKQVHATGASGSIYDFNGHKQKEGIINHIPLKQKRLGCHCDSNMISDEMDRTAAKFCNYSASDRLMAVQLPLQIETICVGCF